jgi:hypothetical protein
MTKQMQTDNYMTEMHWAAGDALTCSGVNDISSGPTHPVAKSGSLRPFELDRGREIGCPVVIDRLHQG